MRSIIFISYIYIIGLQMRFNWADDEDTSNSGSSSNTTSPNLNVTVIEKLLPDFIEEHPDLGLQDNWKEVKTEARYNITKNFPFTEYIQDFYPKDKLNIPSGSTVTFECPKQNISDSQNPPLKNLQLSWRIIDIEDSNLKIITKLNSDKNATDTSNDTTYEIQNSNDGDDGFYMCIMHDNSKIHAARAAALIVDPPPEPFKLQSIVILSVTLVVVCSFSLIGCLTIRHRNQKALLLSRAHEAEAFKNWIKTVVIEKDADSKDILRSPIVRIERKELRGKHGYAENLEYELPPDTQWEFAREKLKIYQTLGEGEFGKVVQADAFGILEPDVWSTVAVKMLKDNHSDEDMVNLVAEVEILKMIGTHKHVLKLLGCCSQGGPLYVITEYALYGNLKDFLRKCNSPQREPTESGNEFVLNNKALINFARQIADGMNYLASIKCIHRDLAARNVLVCKDYEMKVADFGLARDIHYSEYYRNKSKKKLPVKWMAPEALFQRVYTCKSDIWSFGILLWEMMTLGGVPYPSVPVQKLFQVLRDGYRMESPPNCPAKLYALMCDCWCEDPYNRPDFQKIMQYLDEILIDNDCLDVIPTPVPSVHSSTDHLYSSSDDDEDGNDTDSKRVQYPLLKERAAQLAQHPYPKEQISEKLKGSGVKVRQSFAISEGNEYIQS